MSPDQAVLVRTRMTQPNEHEEAWALQLVANGGGVWPLRDNPKYDEAAVSFALEAPDEVTVYLRKDGATVRQYPFQVVPGRDPGDAHKAEAWCRTVGLAMPKIPGELRGQLIELEEGVFTTRPIQQSPYDLYRFIEEARADIVADYAILAYHGGRGHEKMLHYLLRRGPLDFFLQLMWGPTADSDQQASINKLLSVSNQIVENMASAKRAGNLGPQDRLAIICSDHMGRGWSSSGIRGIRLRDLTHRKESPEVLQDALLWAIFRCPPFKPLTDQDAS